MITLAPRTSREANRTQSKHKGTTQAVSPQRLHEKDSKMPKITYITTTSEPSYEDAQRGLFIKITSKS